MDKKQIINELSHGEKWSFLNSIGLISLLGGVMLILEHYFKWGALDLLDFPIGHEYTSLFMILLGFLLLSKQANKKLADVLQKFIKKNGNKK